MVDANSEDETRKALLEMRRYYAAGYSDSEIMRHMSLSEEKFRHYQSQIYAQDQDALEKAVSGRLAHEIMTLKARLESAVRNCHEIASRYDVRVRERLEAERMKIEASVNIVRLLRDGPEALKIGHNRGTKQTADSQKAADKDG
ncbi:hypothetical protein [Nitrososphaera sp.]|uniref:hypothetical protein n=1 Tax=Nitrososphaera sp. TaxID=1971748 RepID=UPI0017C2D6AB|nr:hypothetical protein [Nitrososphaera sp.]NWG38095.1 hypothetical protein [Nitrososphaera sp.]